MSDPKELLAAAKLCSQKTIANKYDNAASLLARHVLATVREDDGEAARPDAFDVAHNVTQFLFDAGYVVRGVDLKLVATEVEKIVARALNIPLQETR